MKGSPPYSRCRRALSPSRRRTPASAPTRIPDFRSDSTIRSRSASRARAPDSAGDERSAPARPSCGQQHEELPSPPRHRLPRRGQELIAAQHEVGVLRTNAECFEFRSLQELGDVGVLHEAIARDDAKKAGAQLADVEALLRRDVRDLLASHGQEEVPLVDDAIDFQIVQQSYRRTGCVAGQIDRGALGCAGLSSARCRRSHFRSASSGRRARRSTPIGPAPRTGAAREPRARRQGETSRRPGS